MSVLLETTEGNLVVDLFYEKEPRACLNFLRLCDLNHYFFSPFYDIHKDQYVCSGNPNFPENGNYAANNFLNLSDRDENIAKERFLEVGESKNPLDLKVGAISFLLVEGRRAIGSQFTICLSNTPQIPSRQLIFGKVVEGFSVLDKINTSQIDEDQRLVNDIRITHTHILHDPFPKCFEVSLKRKDTVPSQVQLDNMRIPQLVEAEDDDVSTYHSLALEIIGDISDHKIKPSPTTLFVARLNPITTEDSLAVLFSRFGQVKGCNIIRSKKGPKGLNYAFVEFQNKTDVESAYYKFNDELDGCIIDGQKVVIDFSHSVSKR